MADDETTQTEPDQESKQVQPESGHLFANDGTNWTTPPSPVDPQEKAAADKEVADAAREGQGPSATNEPR